MGIVVVPPVLHLLHGMVALLEVAAGMEPVVVLVGHLVLLGTWETPPRNGLCLPVLQDKFDAVMGFVLLASALLIVRRLGIVATRNRFVQWTVRVTTIQLMVPTHS